jgi:hypothetical protein
LTQAWIGLPKSDPVTTPPDLTHRCIPSHPRAIRAALKPEGLEAGDLDLVEITEAFA